MRRLRPTQVQPLLRVLRRRERRRLRSIRLKRELKRSRDRALVLAEIRQQKFAQTYNIVVTAPRDYELIMLPERLCLRTNRDETVQALNHLRETVLRQKRRAYLHFDRVRHLEPAAALVLVAEIDRCTLVRPSRLGNTILGNYPDDEQVYAQLCEMGFFKLIKVEADEVAPRGVLPEKRPIFLPFKSLTKVQPGLAAFFVSLVMRGAFQMDDRAKGRMVAALKEAMGNANEHAYVRPTSYPCLPRRWWIAGHLDRVTREMMVLIFDQGIGIPESLEPTVVERLKALRELSLTPSDGSLIAAATDLYRTSTGQAGRGRGFRDMKRFVDTCDDGELRVMSNRGAFSYTKAEEKIDDYASSIGGTLIEWRVRHGAVAEISDG